jgi:hypothetical protein
LCKITILFLTEGDVEVIPWNLDLVSLKEIHTEGIFASLNDCLYRNMYKFDYLILMDLDEYIVPHISDNQNKNNKKSSNSFAMSIQEMINYLVLLSLISKF